MHRSPKHLIAAGLAVAVTLAGCGSDDDSGGASTGSPEGEASALPLGSEHVSLDPAEFTTHIDNPYWPMAPGSRWVYREVEGGSELRVEVTVTERTKVVDGITARVVRDVVTEDGEPVEITDDWYAQDSGGNVWYLGEDTAEYENGKPVSTAGSWEAGVDGAEAGVIMPADPQVGSTYRQEYYEGEAEDFAKVLSVEAHARPPFGNFEGALKTKDVAPLDEPKAIEHKYYAQGVGPVLTIGVSGGGGREELVSFRR